MSKEEKSDVNFSSRVYYRTREIMLPRSSHNQYKNHIKCMKSKHLDKYLMTIRNIAFSLLHFHDRLGCSFTFSRTESAYEQLFSIKFCLPFQTPSRHFQCQIALKYATI